MKISQENFDEIEIIIAIVFTTLFILHLCIIISPNILGIFYIIFIYFLLLWYLSVDIVDDYNSSRD